MTKPIPLASGLWRLPENVLRSVHAIPRDNWRLHAVGQIRLMNHSGSSDSVCLVSRELLLAHQIPATWPALVPVYEKVRQTGGLVAHSALFARDEDGILLIGPSGMGKSTCARRIGHPWSALCDDQVLVVKTDQTYQCHPLPTWSTLWGNPEGRSWNIHRHVKLRAIFFLERSDTNQVRLLGKGQAAAMLSKSAQRVAVPYGDDTNQDDETAFKRLLFDNACELVSSTPCFVLHANLTTRFWEYMDTVL